MQSLQSIALLFILLIIIRMASLIVLTVIIYFIIAFISTLINQSYRVIDYYGPFLYGLSPLSHWKCSCMDLLFNMLISLIAAIIGTILYGLSPLLCLPIVFIIFAKRAKPRMLEYPYAQKAFGCMVRGNQVFDNYIKILSKQNGNLWCDELYLRCIYYTAYHLTDDHLGSEKDRKIYVRALADIIKISSAENIDTKNKYV